MLVPQGQYGQPGVLDPNGPFAPASHDQVVPLSYVVGISDVIDDGGVPPITGTVAATLAAFVSTASGTVTAPSITGTVARTLGNFTSTASGTFTPPPITGTVAVTLGSFTSIAGVFGPFATSVSGRNVLDQFGNVFRWLTASSWSLVMHLTDSEITEALEGVEANNFRGVTFWIGGGYNLNATWDNGTPFSRYASVAHGNFWTGTAWQSSFGPGWASVDWALQECLRLGLTASVSLGMGHANSGAGPEWDSASTTQMHDAGVALATRYPKATYPNVVWHVMTDDDTVSPASSRGGKIQAFFDGINDTEGATARPVRWMEQGENQSTSSSGWLAETTNFKPSINTWYNYNDNAVEIVEATYAEVTAPIGDAEPPYRGAPHYGGNEHQQLRERSWATFIEGGSLINYGDEDWWTFGADGIFTHTLTWDQVQASTPWVEQSYIPPVIEAYTLDTGWAPTSSFVTTGEGTGDVKAAVGASSTAAIAYFPDNRTVQVDTTIITGTANVRLRWYDPTAGTYSTIASSEAQQTGRSVTLPAARGDGTRDWVLVVDLSIDRSGTVAVTLGAFTSAASGTVGRTGSAAVTLGSFTSSATGSFTPPPITGTSATTLGAFVSSASGTFTPQAITGTVAVTLGAFTSSAAGTATPPGSSGTVAVTLGSFVSAASGSFTPLPITGTVAVTLGSFVSSTSGTVVANTGTIAVTLGNFTSSASGTFSPAGSGFAAITLGPFVSTASGTRTIPPITGTSTTTLGAFTSSASGTSTPPSFTGTVARTLGNFTSTATGTATPPGSGGTVAATLGPFLAVGTGTSTPPPIVGTVAVTLGLFVAAAFSIDASVWLLAPHVVSGREPGVIVGRDRPIISGGNR